jgi:hypothetical protein
LKENVDENLMYLKKCVFSVMAVEISLNVHMENEMRHLKHAILRLETTLDMSSALCAICLVQRHSYY